MPPSITDVPGILVGHAQDDQALTGCTVVLALDGAVGGVDVRGGGPGTRETDLLDPTANVSVVHAVTLCGGSGSLTTTGRPGRMMPAFSRPMDSRSGPR